MGEEIRRGWGGRQVEPRRKAGTAEVEAYKALPRRTGTAGNGQGLVGTEGRLAGNEGKDRWRRPAPTISCPLKAHDKRGA